MTDPELTITNPDAELSDAAIESLATLLLLAVEDGEGES